MFLYPENLISTGRPTLINATKISGISTSQYIELVSSRLINIEDFETSMSYENSLFPITPSNCAITLRFLSSAITSPFLTF